MLGKNDSNSAAEAQHYAGQTVIVTGGTGYIGSSLISALSGKAARIIRISRKKNAHLDGIIDVVGELSEPETWNWVNEADVVFHLAGETSFYAAAADPLGCLTSNVISVIRAIEAVHKSPRRPALVIAGTVTQVGMVEELPVNISVPENPVTVCDLHKLMAEKHLSLAVTGHGIRGCCLRLANVYGPSPSTASATDRGVINKLVRAACAGQPLTVFGHGNYVRDYVYIDDVVSAFLTAGARDNVQDGKGWIISSGVGTTLNEVFGLIAERVSEVTGTLVPVTCGEWPEGVLEIEFRNFIGDSSGFSEATGWAPKTSLLQGIDLTIAMSQI